MAATARPDPERVADRLHSSAVHLLRRLRREDPATGLSAARLSALSFVAAAGMPKVGEVAVAEQVSAATISRIVGGLETDGLVRRVQVAGDARSYRVRATPKGRRVMIQGRRRRVRALAASLRTLPKEDLATLDAAADVLDRLLAEGR
jgi:DNA-binding MarR family transcriptional regulator